MSITNVNSVTDTGVNGATNTTSNKKQLSPDDFMKLFITQLKNQNPTHPADSSTMLQQMADISMLSAAKASQESVDDLKKTIAATLADSQFLGASNLIGKNIEVVSDKAVLPTDKELSGTVAISDGLASAKVTIKDAQGVIVNEINYTNPAKGLLDFKWDGKGKDGKVYDPGVYSISASAVTANGEQIKLDTASSFKVKSVGLNAATNQVMLNVDGLDGYFGLMDIVRIV